jgi:hypothetical protein
VRLSGLGPVLALGVPFQLILIEVNLAQVPLDVSFGLIVEVLRLRIAALSTGRYRPRAHAILAKLDYRNEAVPTCAVPLLRARIRSCAKACKRTNKA